VHRGQDQDQPGGRGSGGLGCVIHLVLAQGLDDAVGVLAGPEALDRAAEDRLVLLAEGEQGTSARPGRWRGGIRAVPRGRLRRRRG